MSSKKLLQTRFPYLNAHFANKLSMLPKMGITVMAHKDIDVDTVVVASQFIRKWTNVLIIKDYSLNQSSDFDRYFAAHPSKLV